MCGIVPIPVHVPNVRDVVVFETGMNALADSDQSIFVAAREP
jgi:hypothetical protein